MNPQSAAADSTLDCSQSAAASGKLDSSQSAGGVGLDWQYKGWPRSGCSADIESITAASPNLFTSDFMFPVAVISAGALEHNIATVSRFCDDMGVSLAPHGKTTLSPEIIRRQLNAGAWAITAATANQARTFRAFGVERLLIAHQLVDPAGVRWVSDELSAHPEVQIICLIDSVAGVEAMERALRGRPEGRRIDVLVELGISGGRTGCRDVEEALETAGRAASSPRLRLAGVEAFEGIIGDDEGSEAVVDALLHGLRRLLRLLDGDSQLDCLDEVIVSAGGSMHLDRVVAVLGGNWKLRRPVRLVVRSGCYATHDSRLYARSSPFGTRAPMDDYPRLKPALTVWSYVVSRPEPTLALLGFGKFDASYDVDFPIPVIVRRGSRQEALAGQLEVFKLDDQHAYVRVPEGFRLSVGDIVGCGISHPCTTFQCWRLIPLVDSDYNVTGAVRTFI